ncbi:NADH-quinone oxidoreductase subunit NuoN [Gordonia hankookensis]|uniref:NADH-quinone oxidoreductase subunit N n=1 Tax=Gordonia hankookensis TaxID=589403 RepID=A0ABR7WCF8_9ACTN|nr:NADH-quinone oxidoreductase subunit NuoN [Gordonia hankookensis]MBD1320236.1 NADH-quinone oxidoreductase subunit NuoN [Gordonia hankookensis]
MTSEYLAAIDPPSVEYGLLSPMLIVFGVAVAGVLVEAFAPRRFRYRTQLTLALGGLAAAFAALVAVAVAQTRNGGHGQFAMAGSVVIDRPALFLQGILLLVSILAIAFMAERRLERVVAAPAITLRVSDGPGAAAQAALDSVDADMFTPSGASVPNTDAEFEATRAGAITTEVFPLTLLAVGGMMLFPACGDLLTMFIALEVFSLPLYLLCGLARRRRLISQEASLKYFLLGAFSSAFFLFGAAFAYGATGSLQLGAIGRSVGAPGADSTLPLIALGLLSVGLLFKIGAVPFHSWIPDVYQGAPTTVTAFMAAATKIAAFGGLLRVFFVGFPDLKNYWEPALWAVAIATMLAGAVMAVTQTDVKRMLAYSSITHTGFILLGLVAFDDAGAASGASGPTQPGLAATMFYLAAYAFSTFGAFATVAVVREPDRVSGPHLSGREATEIAQWAGLGRRYPLVGAMFSMFLLAFAGIPLTSGFIAKFDVFAAVAGAGGGVLVVIGVISSAIAAYFYIRIIVAMFFADVPVGAPHVVKPSVLTTSSIAVCTVVTIVLGIFPQPLLDLTRDAAQFLA